MFWQVAFIAQRQFRIGLWVHLVFWPRSSLIAAVAGSRLVLLVPLHLVLCSFVWSSGPRCSASWPVRTRRTRYVPLLSMTVDNGSDMCLTGIAGFALCSAYCRQACAVRHHGLAFRWSSWTRLFVASSRNDRFHGPDSLSRLGSRSSSSRTLTSPSWRFGKFPWSSSV